MTGCVEVEGGVVITSIGLDISVGSCIRSRLILFVVVGVLRFVMMDVLEVWQGGEALGDGVEGRRGTSFSRSAPGIFHPGANGFSLHSSLQIQSYLFF